MQQQQTSTSKGKPSEQELKLLALAKLASKLEEKTNKRIQNLLKELEGSNAALDRIDVFIQMNGGVLTSEAALKYRQGLSQLADITQKIRNGEIVVKLDTPQDGAKKNRRKSTFNVDSRYEKYDAIAHQTFAEGAALVEEEEEEEEEEYE